jgi:hypothetical protein
VLASSETREASNVQPHGRTRLFYLHEDLVDGDAYS